MKKTLVIPSAGKATRLYPLSRSIPKVMIEINGMPIFNLLYKKAKEIQADNIIVIVDKCHKEVFHSFIKHNYANATIDIVITVNESLSGVTGSVSCGTLHEKCNEEVILILSDTILNEHITNEKEFIYYAKVEDYYEGNLSRWCLLEKDKINNICSFLDKPTYPIEEGKAVIGVYGFFKELFNNSCKTAMGKELSHVFEEYMKINKLKAVEVSDVNNWIDTGTLKNLKIAEEKLFFTRGFNNIYCENNILTKVSTDKEKLMNEYLWGQSMHKYVTPKIYGIKEKKDTFEIKMEKSTFNNLATILYFSEPVHSFFEQTIEKLIEIMYFGIGDGYVLDDSLRVANYNMFVQKMQDRLKDSTYIIPLEYFSSFLSEISSTDMLDGKRGIIHGDFTLSNILFDPKSFTFLFIDGRGSYGGKQGRFGDIRYDFAKLYHSLDGKYEAIIYDLFEIIDDKVVYFMSEEKQGCFELAKKQVVDFAVKHLLIKNERELKLLEASLYFSMLPLHSDNPKRQKAFYLIACKLLEELYGHR